MREILFRGKAKQKRDYLNSMWVEGSLLIMTFGVFIYVVEKDDLGNVIRDFECEVIPETVGQFTGLLDKNGNKIFEGDVVRWSDGTYIHKSNPRIAVVEFSPELAFYAVNCEENTTNKYNGKIGTGHKFGFSNFIYKDTHKHLEIIGNIHDNPELLEDK